MALSAKEKAALERAKTATVNRAQNMVNSKASLRVEAQSVIQQSASVTAPTTAVTKATEAATEAAKVAASLGDAQAEIAGIHKKRSLSTIGEAETKVTAYCQDAEVALGAAKALLKEAVDFADEKAKIENVTTQVETLRGEIKSLFDDLEVRAKSAQTLADDAKKYSDKVTKLRPGSQEATDASSASTDARTAADEGSKVVNGDSSKPPPDNVKARLATADTELKKARDIRDGKTAGDLAEVELCLTEARRAKEATQTLAEIFSRHETSAKEGHDKAKEILDEIEKIIIDPLPKRWWEKLWKGLCDNWQAATWAFIALVAVAIAGFFGNLKMSIVIITIVAMLVSIFATKGASATKMAIIAITLAATTRFVNISNIPVIGEYVTRGGQPEDGASQTECRTGWADDPCATMSYQIAASPLFWIFATMAIMATVGAVEWKFRLIRRLPTVWRSIRRHTASHTP